MDGGGRATPRKGDRGGQLSIQENACAWDDPGGSTRAALGPHARTTAIMRACMTPSPHRTHRQPPSHRHHSARTPRGWHHDRGRHGLGPAPAASFREAWRAALPAMSLPRTHPPSASSILHPLPAPAVHPTSCCQQLRASARRDTPNAAPVALSSRTAAPEPSAPLLFHQPRPA